MNRPPPPSILDAAIAEFLEEGYVYGVNQHEIEQTPPELREEYLGEILPKRNAPEGCFVWIRYLVWLDGVREFATGLRLSAAEAQGLSLLHRGRNRFGRTHPPCRMCGMPNEESNYRCHACMAELKK